MKRSRQRLEAWISLWADEADRRFKSAWPVPVVGPNKERPDGPHPQWDGFAEAFKALPHDKQQILAEFCYEFALDALGVMPRNERAAAIEIIRAKDRRSWQALKALKDDSIGFKGGPLGFEVNLRATRLFHALAERYPQIKESDIESEVMKLVCKAGALKGWSRAFVRELIDQAPETVKDSYPALSEWLRIEWGIRRSAESIRQDDKK